MGWIGCDLDGTLAEWGEGTSNPCDVCRIGDPIPGMVDRVQTWLALGKDVRIFTARVGPATDTECARVNPDTPTELDWHAYQVMLIRSWCEQHLGRVLPITATKDFHMAELWDDRCVQVVPNQGRSVVEAFHQIVAETTGVTSV